MKVKEVESTARLAWSPKSVNSLYLACGSAAKYSDPNFTSSPTLKIFEVSPAEHNLSMKTVASIDVPSRYHKLLWGNIDIASAENPFGIIVGGCENGDISLYNSNNLISGKNALIATLSEKHSSSVFSIDFNAFQHNLLASGSGNCEIFIWDLNDYSSPMTPGIKPNLNADVTSIAWNRQVEHIMSSTYGGNCVVYDLRKNASIIQINDTVSRLSAHSVCWHPEVATQLVLSSENDQTPVAQVWDLRFASTPLRVLEGHQRGILSCVWCLQDADILITSGKDNRIIVWYPNASDKAHEIIGEFPAYNLFSFDISWCRQDPTLVAASSVDGIVSVYSIMGGGLPPSQNNKFSAIADSFPGMEMPINIPQIAQPQPIYLKKPPKWLSMTSGARFCFGGHLLSWNHHSYTVSISQVVSEPELVKQSSQLEQALLQPDISAFCKTKIELSSGKEQEIWKFIDSSFGKSEKDYLMSLLGYSSTQVSGKVLPTETPNDGYIENSSLDPADQFDMIASRQTSGPVLDLKLQSSSLPNILYLPVDNSVEGMRCQALILGDLESAIELSLKEKNYSHALITAAYAGLDHFEKTRDRILLEEASDLSFLLGAIVRKDLSYIVEHCSLKMWKEAFITVLTYGTSKEFSMLIEQIGQRLEAAGGSENLHYATLCYLCAGNLEKFVNCWCARHPSVNYSSSDLQLLIEFITVAHKALATSGHAVDLSEYATISHYMCKYASLLASQGALSTAVSYIGSAKKGKMVQLRDRLYRALGYLTGGAQEVRSRTVSSSSNPPSTFRKTSTPFTHQASQPSQRLFDAHHFISNVPSGPPVPPPVQMANGVSGIRRGAIGNRYASNAPSASSSASYGFPNQPITFESYNPVSVAPFVGSSQNSVLDNRSTNEIGGSLYNTDSYALPPAAAYDANVPRGWNDPPPVSGGKKIKGLIVSAVRDNTASTTNSNPPISNMPAPEQFPGFQPQLPMQVPAANKFDNQIEDPPPPPVKEPIPVEHKIIKDVLDGIRNHGLMITQNVAVKQRLEELGPKIEILYDKITSGELSGNTLNGLHQIVQSIQVGDYHTALRVHTATVASGNFSELSQFMPSLKLLITICMQGQIFLQ